MSVYEGRSVLIVDDDETIRTLLAESLRREGLPAVAVGSVDEALEILVERRFDLVLSDVRMPGKSGLDLLAEILRRFEGVGVIMLTGCEDVAMAVTAMKMGALDYLQKPFSLQDMIASVRQGLERRDEEIQKASYMQQLEETVHKQSMQLRSILEHLHEASEITLEALVNALDVREHETQAHSRRVSEYTIHLANELGTESTDLEVIRRGALLHDIGKIGISDRILMKPDTLTEVEWMEMRRHPQIGYWILSGIAGLRAASDIVLSHHERYDGLGYPRRLKGMEIPHGARIFSVVDTLDAMTCDRVYRKARSYEEAREEILQNSSTQFDPEVVQAFCGIPPEKWSEIRERTLQERPQNIPEIDQLILN